jgi:hypothetical protein
MSYIFTLTTPERKSWDGDYYSPPKTVTLELDVDDLTVDQLCASFQDFLKGCGFYLDSGTIQFVENEEDCAGDYPQDDYPEDDTQTTDPAQNIQMEFNFAKDDKETNV